MGGAKNELHLAETKAMDYEGSPSKAMVAVLKNVCAVNNFPWRLENYTMYGLDMKCGPWSMHTVEEDPRSEAQKDVKLFSECEKQLDPRSSSKVQQKAVKLVATKDDDFVDEETK